MTLSVATTSRHQPGSQGGLESRGFIASLTALKTLLVLSEVGLVRSYCCWSWRLLWRLWGCGGWSFAGECYETLHTSILRGITLLNSKIKRHESQRTSKIIAQLRLEWFYWEISQSLVWRNESRVCSIEIEQHLSLRAGEGRLRVFYE